MAKAKSYYSQAISPNMSETIHGYLICHDVPICRSGFQEYLGSELDGMPGYEASWGLDPFKRYKVYRPKKEVTDPNTIKSFEGNTIVDEHPDGSFVLIDNDQQLNCGHTQNVRQGPDHDGEVTIIADLHIKNPMLRDKIQNKDARDVSCGYLIRLVMVDGNIEMHNIIGNHVAVVEKGRAGPRISIKDSAPPEIKQRKVSHMSVLDMILGRGVKAYAAEATDEDLTALGKKLFSEPTPKQPVAIAVDTAAAVDKKPEEKPAEDAATVGARAAVDACMKAMKDGDMKALKRGKKALDALFAVDSEEEEEKPAEDSKVEELKEEKPAEDKEEGKPAEDGGESAEKQFDDHGKSVLGELAVDSAVRSYLKVTKPLVAVIANKPLAKRSSAEKLMLDSYNGAVRGLNGAEGKAYKVFAVQKTPDNIPAIATDSSAADTEDVSRFYEGVPYNTGKKRHQEYLDRKGNK